MRDESVRHDDLINRVAAGRLARELLDEFLAAGATERAMGLVQFCDKMGVTIPGSPWLVVVRDGEE